MDLPDDLQLDEGEGKDEDGQDEENPFDIDAMKGNTSRRINLSENFPKIISHSLLLPQNKYHRIRNQALKRKRKMAITKENKNSQKWTMMMTITLVRKKMRRSSIKMKKMGRRKKKKKNPTVLSNHS